MSSLIPIPSAVTSVFSTVSTHRRWILATLLGWYILRVLNRLHDKKTRTWVDSRGRPYPLEKHIFPNYLLNKQSLWLYTRSWSIPNPRGIIFIVHGLGEHITRYEHVAESFNAAGYSVYGMDHQGCGQSQGSRCYVEKFDDLVIDYIQFIKHIQSKLGKPIPNFLFGHSLGGAIAIQVMRATYTPTSTPTDVWPWTGCILSAPAILPDPNAATPFMRWLARHLSHLLPKLGIEQLDSTTISRIPAVVAQYQNDPLIYHGVIQANFGQELLLTFDSIRSSISTFEWPFLVIHGDQDRLVKVDGSKQLVEHAASHDKSIKIYNGGYHELLNDLVRDQVVDDVIMWIKARTKLG